MAKAIEVDLPAEGGEVHIRIIGSDGVEHIIRLVVEQGWMEYWVQSRRGAEGEWMFADGSRKPLPDLTDVQVWYTVRWQGKASSGLDFRGFQPLEGRPCTYGERGDVVALHFICETATEEAALMAYCEQHNHTCYKETEPA